MSIIDKNIHPKNTENFNHSDGEFMHACRSIYTLEQYQTKLRMNAYSFGLLLKNESTGEDFFFKPKARSLWVDEQRKDYLAPRMAKIRKALLSFNYAMITLTYWTELYSPEEVAERHKKDINRWTKAMRQIYGRFEYAYFIEVTEQQYVHFHIFVSKKISQSRAKQIWCWITGSYIVHRKVIHNTKIAVNYVNKYCSKIADGSEENLEFMFRNIDRFFGCSQNFFAKNSLGPPKEIFKLICNIYLSNNIYNALDEQKLISSMVPASKFATIMGLENMGLEFEYGEDGELRGNLKHFASEQAKIEYYLDFQENRGLSWSQAIDNDIILYIKGDF
jgi:hypothetical protein